MCSCRTLAAQVEDYPELFAAIWLLGLVLYRAIIKGCTKRRGEPFEEG
jgi:hypothetical protein